MRRTVIGRGMKNSNHKVDRRIRIARRARRVEADARRIRRGSDGR